MNEAYTKPAGVLPPDGPLDMTPAGATQADRLISESSARNATGLVAVLALGVALAIASPAGAFGRTLQQQPGSAPRPGSRGGAANAGSAAESAVPADTIVTSSDDYQIGPSDVIDVRVEDAPELSRTFTVAADGTFQMPYLHQISASHMTPPQLEKLIVDGLRGRYLVDPHVTVTVLRFNSRSYFIEGAVHSPGMYIVQGKPSLMKLITIAGGLADNHGSTAFIIREISHDEPDPSAAANSPAPAPVIASAGAPVMASAGAQATGDGGASAAKPAQNAADADPETQRAKYELIKANINGLFRGEFSQDRPIEPGDIINIPPTDVFFVAGEVHKAGSFSLKEGATLRQAISMAEGTTFKAATHRAVIFRDDPKTGRREELHVDLGKVMAGKADDIPILANDIIEIPNSKSRSAFGMILTGLGTSALRAPIP